MVIKPQDILPDEIFNRIGDELEDGEVKVSPKVAKRFVERCMYHDIYENFDEHKDDKDCFYEEILWYIDAIKRCVYAIHNNLDEVILENNPMSPISLIVYVERAQNDKD